MTSLTVTLRYGSTPTSGTVEAIPRTANGVVPGNDIMALGPWRTSINGTGSLAGQGTLTFPADDFTDLTWSFRIRWDAGDKTVTFGPYTYDQIIASGVTSLADLIEVEVLEYVATSTLVQRVEALEAGGGGGGGGGGGSVAWVDITGKPLTFPPATHGHPWSEVTGKPTTFPPSAHTHGAGDLTGVVKSVNGVGPDGGGNVVVSGGGGGTTYDSGGRNITALMPSGWSFPDGAPAMRREGKTVHLEIYLATTNGAGTITFPNGFRPWRPTSVVSSAAQIQFYPTSTGSSTYWLDAAAGAAKSLHLSWLTDDAEPVTLPGSPL